MRYRVAKANLLILVENLVSSKRRWGQFGDADWHHLVRILFSRPWLEDGVATE